MLRHLSVFTKCTCSNNNSQVFLTLTKYTCSNNNSQVFLTLTKYTQNMVAIYGTCVPMSWPHSQAREKPGNEASTVACTLWCIGLILFSRQGGVAAGNLIELLPHIAHTVYQMLLDTGPYLAKILIQFWRDDQEGRGGGGGGEEEGRRERTGGEGRRGREGEGRGGGTRVRGKREEGRVGGKGRGGEKRGEKREKKVIGVHVA